MSSMQNVAETALKEASARSSGTPSGGTLPRDMLPRDASPAFTLRVPLVARWIAGGAAALATLVSLGYVDPALASPRTWVLVFASVALLWLGAISAIRYRIEVGEPGFAELRTFRASRSWRWDDVASIRVYRSPQYRVRHHRSLYLFHRNGRRLFVSNSLTHFPWFIAKLRAKRANLDLSELEKLN